VPREAVTKVSVHVPKAYAGMIATRAEPGARQSTMVSAAHQVALAALAPERLYDVDRSAAAHGAADVAVAQLAAKVEIVPDDALGSYYPQHWPAEVRVEAGGEVFKHRVVEAKGDPENPLSKAEIDDKAHHVLDPLLGSARAAEWLQLGHAALDDTSACRRLAAAFADGF
jgi:2-methylcitrate dehydratase PrpD